MHHHRPTRECRQAEQLGPPAFKFDFRLKIFSVSGGAAWGDRVRVRIYSDPIPVAAPPDFTDTSFSPSRSSCMISLIFLLVSQAE